MTSVVKILETNNSKHFSLSQRKKGKCCWKIWGKSKICSQNSLDFTEKVKIYELNCCHWKNVFMHYDNHDTVEENLTEILASMFCLRSPEGTIMSLITCWYYKIIICRNVKNFITVYWTISDQENPKNVNNTDFSKIHIKIRCWPK